MTSRETVNYQYQGHAVSGQYRLMLVCVRRAGRWQIVAGQGTAIAQ
ncbi:MAG: hypothetical protein HY238_13650 [Acidobacteria bacterium]|nr:hypothetical protein [Acidobacteriota bacterium]